MPRSPDRQASLERRRRQAASGALPPALAARFTTGELAALTVIARQCQKGGVCALPIDAIAALAGVSRKLGEPAENRRAEPPDQIAELLRIIGGSHAQAGMRALCFRLA